jgi:hypothetical protein
MNRGRNSDTYSVGFLLRTMQVDCRPFEPARVTGNLRISTSRQAENQKFETLSATFCEPEHGRFGRFVDLPHRAT